jgi:hypothetical protein
MGNSIHPSINPTTLFQLSILLSQKHNNRNFYENMFWGLHSSSFLGSTAQFRPWPPPQNPAEFLAGFSTIFFFTG